MDMNDFFRRSRKSSCDKFGTDYLPASFEPAELRKAGPKESAGWRKKFLTTHEW
jgi:hypothetical protein